jgi:hypothetical protein
MLTSEDHKRPWIVIGGDSYKQSRMTSGRGYGRSQLLDERILITVLSYMYEDK